MTIRAISLSVLFFSSLAFGQGLETSSKTRSVSDRQMGSKGFVAGLVYSNLTDINLKTSITSYRDGVKIKDDSDSSKSGTHIGLMGLNLGYKSLYSFGSFGFDGGLQILRGINGSEFPSNINIFKAYGDLILPVNDRAALSIGLNLSHFDGLAEGDTKTELSAGAQAGVEFRIEKATLMLGYQMLGITEKFSSSYASNGSTFKSDGRFEGLISGFITQVSYTF